MARRSVSLPLTAERSAEAYRGVTANLRFALRRFVRAMTPFACAFESTERSSPSRSDQRAAPADPAPPYAVRGGVLPAAGVSRLVPAPLMPAAPLSPALTPAVVVWTAEPAPLASG